MINEQGHIKKLTKSVVVFLGVLTLTSACGSTSTNNSDTGKTMIEVDGSSTVYPITNEIAQEYQLISANQPEIRVNVSGTGGGFRRFCAGETDINDASRPINAEEMETCEENGVKYVELPVAYDALSVVVHPDNDWVSEITTETLAKIWQPSAETTVMQWNEVNSQWPRRPLNLYGPGVDSGTFDYFTEAIVGKAGASRQDYIDSEDDTLIVRGVSEDPYALGYFGYSYYEENQKELKALAIDNGSGAVMPSRETVRTGEYQPLSRPLLIYVNVESLETKPELSKFLEYYLTQGRPSVKVVGSIPLPDEIYNLALKRMENKQTGTVFEGETPINLKIEDLLQKEARSYINSDAEK
ncbi:phosphate ABC transporter substrate-binding protein, PhoT family [Halothece sp. PCC 7418]|uniref:PstS family phosphate ABC transporter substrate-binding protein n=1 Tax=Halothece sp. (strain PCC 7418) TaxID=65093 RepID=UPI0002A0670B|nr:PstS family phosphate ABC transporter substrate-binding protein [Halothece sp. PCC 7418]AFZ42624.1 phosphate ABC transporter substrate-binding protein, PhoT family [Halothece sp. PCC 7418]